MRRIVVFLLCIWVLIPVQASVVDTIQTFSSAMQKNTVCHQISVTVYEQLFSIVPNKEQLHEYTKTKKNRQL